MDGSEGKKLLFVYTTYTSSADKFGMTHLCVASDGKTFVDVTDIAVQLAHKNGGLAPYAEFGRDFRFAGVKMTGPGIANVLLDWDRSDAGPSPRAIPLAWSDIRAAVEGAQPPPWWSFSNESKR